MGRKGKQAPKKEEKKKKGKKEDKKKEPEPEPDGDEEEEDIMGDQSWAKTDNFSGALDDMMGDLLGDVASMKADAEEAGVDLNAKISGMGDDAAEAEAEEAAAAAKAKTKREAKKALLASLSEEEKKAQLQWKPTLRQVDKDKEVRAAGPCPHRCARVAFAVKIAAALLCQR
jgi:hypothetical protein